MADIRLSHTERRTITVEEAGRRLGVSRGSAYEAVRRGEIPTIRIGRLLLVPLPAFERLLDQPDRTQRGAA
ncbi:excisionase family DNA-binding protein [Methylobacterium nigriterrae]|uniref:excisionase family DNA-binding protein n=1 Tax=Methylobacterium nigriterrae TaxID=3127512 RepID=UPI003013ABD7